MIKSSRIPVSVVYPTGDLNIRPQYAIQKTSWISHSAVTQMCDIFLTYKCDFTLNKGEKFTIHVSADQRFMLYIDNEYIGMGPDRSDLQHWCFQTYEIEIDKGDHCIVAYVQYLTHAYSPQAQISLKPGFILASEHCSVDLSTGTAPWKARLESGYSLHRVHNLAYHDIGPSYTMDLNSIGYGEFVDCVVVLGPIVNNDFGVSVTGWRLYPTDMPEQIATPFMTGKVRMISSDDGSGVLEETESTIEWDSFVKGNSVSVDPGKQLSVLIDLEQYYCAFVNATFSGGKNATVRILWSEACYEIPEGKEPNAYFPKGNRNTIAGKRFLGFGDTIIVDGTQRRSCTVPWWRSGRYVLITIVTKDDPLIIENMNFVETRYPLENVGSFKSSDLSLIPIENIAIRGIQMCSHETFMDCPFYEQLMYVGDTRLQMLTTYVMTSDDRLVRRGIELFNISRSLDGFVAERYPSKDFQLSCTFSMIWIMMLKDYAFWKRDPSFVRKMMGGMRSLLEQFRDHLGTDKLLPPLPGWSFMDWVPSWDKGYAPDSLHEPSAIVNLLFLCGLRSAIILEEQLGDPYLVNYNKDLYKLVANEIKDKFWSEKHGLFADNLKQTSWSEHAQCLAILSDAFDSSITDVCFKSLITTNDLAQTTIYFSFYLFEVFRRYNRADLIEQRLDFWKNLDKLGLKTPVEAPEPSRSDCHAWGSHPLFHFHATTAGIRPLTLGFTKVSIRPQPGSLTFIESKIPHPDGFVYLRMEKKSSVWDTVVILPKNVTGELVWNDQIHELVDLDQCFLL